tara:strand:- start:68 stop:304 length:237 start_codon:yes stop_codon:yes gene_type:complete
MDSENGKMLSKCGYLGFHFAQNMRTDTTYRDCIDISFNSSDKQVITFQPIEVLGQEKQVNQQSFNIELKPNAFSIVLF